MRSSQPTSNVGAPAIKGAEKTARKKSYLHARSGLQESDLKEQKAPRKYNRNKTLSIDYEDQRAQSGSRLCNSVNTDVGLSN